MVAILGSLAALYLLVVLFLRFPVLAWLGTKRLSRCRDTAKWLFYREPLKVRLVRSRPDTFMPGAPAPDMTPWRTDDGLDANCFAHAHDVVEDGRSAVGLNGSLQEDHLLLQRLYWVMVKGGKWLWWPRLLVGLRLDGLRRCTWLSLLRRERRHLVLVLHEPNTKNSHAHRLNRDGSWSDKPGESEVRSPSDPAWRCGLTGYKVVGFFWVNHLDSTVRAVHGKEPRTRVRLRKALPSA